MKIFKVSYELTYPECDNDLRIAYVMAKDFNDAERKVEREEDREFESASIYKIEKINAKIIV